MPKEPGREVWRLVCPKELVDDDAKELLTFIQLDPYTDSYDRLGLTDDEQRAVETGIMLDPTMPPVIEGTGGIREFQFSTPQTNPGSLHLSAFYAYFPEGGKVALIELVETEECEPLTEGERAELKLLFEELQQFGPEAWEA